MLRGVTLPIQDKVIFFDCDSTISSVEGIDELARAATPELHAEVERLTLEAMEGRISVESVFGKRLKIIRPTRESVEALAELYLQTLTPGLEKAIALLQERGWSLGILSGGFRQAILPLGCRFDAVDVGAVDLFFDDAGAYTGFDERFPTTRSGGKPEYLSAWRVRHPEVKTLVMVGDGVSDLETRPVVDLFIGYGGVVDREKVREGSEFFVLDHSEIPAILDGKFPKQP